jgi:hypothetical protein
MIATNGFLKSLPIKHSAIQNLKSKMVLLPHVSLSPYFPISPSPMPHTQFIATSLLHAGVAKPLLESVRGLLLGDCYNKSC